MKKVLLAGGHGATTAYAVSQKITEKHPDWEIYFLGKRWATEDKKTESLEYQYLKKLGVKFIEIDSGKVQTKLTKYTLPALIKIPYGFVKSFFSVLKILPDVTLSFGSASGAQAIFCSKLLRIPTVIHEQTVVAGRANLFSAKFADKVALGFRSSEKYFKKYNTVVTGNPVRNEIFDISRFKKAGKRVILVTGGSRGSVILNKNVRHLINRLTKDFKVIHQTGPQDYTTFEKLKGKDYEVYDQVNPSDWANLLNKADIVVSRAGANTVTEIALLKKPSILIPIPWSYMNEQTKNADLLAKSGLAHIIEQDDLTPEVLEKAIYKVAENANKVLEKLRNKNLVNKNGSSNLVSMIEKLVK